MARNKPGRCRATVAGSADRHAIDLAGRLGLALRDARTAAGLTQAQAGVRAGIAQSIWSRLEISRDPRFTLATWDRAAFAVGSSMEAFIRGGSAANAPRDAVHLKAQELIVRNSVLGRWQALPEEMIDREARSSRAADVLLHRRWPPPRASEYALMEVIDWFADVGAPMRAWSGRIDAVDRYAVARMRDGDPVAVVSGCWVVRATRRNRALIGEHRNLFQARFPGSGHAWLQALTSATEPMPTAPAILWVSVIGDRLFPARLG